MSNALSQDPTRQQTLSTTASSSTKPINLVTGWPSPDLLALGEIKDASSHALAQSSPTGVQNLIGYAPDEGSKSLREGIAQWLTTFYAPSLPISPTQICISGGASQNLACLLQTFTDPVYTRNIWLIVPTYFLACRMFDDAGFSEKLRAVPEDDEGIDMDYITREIRSSESSAVAAGNLRPVIKPERPWRKIYKHIIYGVPTFANPSGKVISLRRREALVRLARQYDALVVTDDVYDMLQWPVTSSTETSFPRTACQPRMVDVDSYLDGGPSDEYGNCVSNGSFSKIVAPGCRTGWAQGTEKLAYGLSQTGSSRSGGAPSHLVAQFMSELLPDKLPKYINGVLQPAYARRYYVLKTAVENDLLPLGVTLPPAGVNGLVGGYFLWLKLPTGIKSAAFVDASKRVDVIIQDGAGCRATGNAARDQEALYDKIRLCFSWENESRMQEAVRRLAKVLKDLLHEAND